MALYARRSLNDWHDRRLKSVALSVDRILNL